ncbi:signal-transducing adaptor protein 1-like isoform X2 [Pristis pectinata]|uniref:signal-transducing adaptor protein 1-like isoform X2 n=1 Tax=Pristis pectinata TaxID=685728 RepID=UPI00223D3F64|nr:signal-transducing adaptor protein 1-like isoform X2 [Pristis pectinata]
MSSPRPVRYRAFLVPGYYDGYLGKQETKSQKYKRYWTVLRGNELFFQMTSRDPTYIEKISLDNFVSVENDDSRNNNQQNTFILKLKSGHTKLEADSLEAREQWKGFIHTVAKLEVPNLDFLPGQIHRLQEVCEAETKRRQKPASSPPALPPPRSRPSTPEFAKNDYDDVENNLPSCFYEVTRLEAEALLEKNVEHGNMLMRPSSNNKNLSITTRQVFKNNSIIKHYRISSTDNGYIIEVDDGIPCSSRQEVINFFIQHTQGVLKPLEIPADYEINLSYVQEDAESGELIHQKLHTLKLSPTKTSTQPVNKEKWSPKIPKNIEPEPDYLNDNEIPKESLPARPKIQQPARPSQSNTLPGLTYAVNKELQLKLQQRRAAMCD